MNLVRVFAVAAAFTSVVLVASAQPGAPPKEREETIPAVLAGNLPADFYTKVQCETPQTFSLSKPSFGDREGIALYNAAVGRHNKQSKAFGACINVYVDNARNDIDWIMFTVNTAVAKTKGSNPPAAPLSPGNMAFGIYPSPNCVLPNKQTGFVPDGHDTKAMDAYYARVRVFNVLAAGFNDCIKDYVTRAQADIEHVEQAQKNAASLVSGQ